MKKLCLLSALLLLLSGCGREIAQPQGPVETAPVTESAQSGIVSFDIYAINDLHGKMVDTQMQPGVDELSAYLKQQENAILLSTGDMWQGSAESNLTGGFIITEWMNEMDFAAMTIGGHEYDWGEEQIRENKQLAEFPFLGINVYDRTTDKQADYCQSSLVVEMDGAQIGIIGAIGDCSGSISSENLQNVYFKVGDELTALVKAEAEKLRSEGVDFIIYCIHDGHDETSSAPVSVSGADLKDYYDTALSDGCVDLVFEADSHYEYVLLDEYGVYHLQAGGNNNAMSHARVLLDKAGGDAQVLTAELLPTNKYGYMEADPAVTELLEKYAGQIAPGQEILGNNGQYRNNAGVCQLVANMYCAAGVETWGEQYDIVLGGGYISCRSPGFLPAGEVTYGQLISLLPFDNQITLCSIKGSDLISKFLENDHWAYYIKTTPYGESVRSSIDPDGVYYVVTDSYSACYAPNNMTVIDVYSEEIFARDLLADYIASGGLG